MLTYIKKINKALIILFLVFITIGFLPVFEIMNLPNNLIVSSKEYETLHENNAFGPFVKMGSLVLRANSGEKSECDKKIKFKLFNLIPIREVNANVVDETIYASGDIVGFSLNSEGVIIIGSTEVLTKDGKVNTIAGTNIEKGDLLISIEGQKIDRLSDISNVINEEKNAGRELDVVTLKRGKEYTNKIKPALDVQSKRYKLGMWVKDDATGIGTLTFVREDNKRFGALGHAICEADTKKPFEVNSGEMYNCTIIGCKKGERGKPGELKGLFIQSKNYLGVVDKNNEFGVFGEVNDIDRATKNSVKLEIGGRLSARPGKAKIRTSIDGDGVKDYDIEIIKTNYQSAKNDKSMVIRVVDRELLAKTGGIVQGMSGSPIIQDGKLIGAVTHVFVSDPTKGFGVYLDWMLDE